MDTELFAGYKELAAEEGKKETGDQKKPTRSRTKAVEEAEAEAWVRNDKQLAYKFFVELATKVTVLPIHPKRNTEIHLVEGYWQEELRKTPVANLAAVECILEMDADSLDDVLAKWNDLNRVDVE